MAPSSFLDLAFQSNQSAICFHYSLVVAFADRCALVYLLFSGPPVARVSVLRTGCYLQGACAATWHIPWKTCLRVYEQHCTLAAPFITARLQPCFGQTMQELLQTGRLWLDSQGTVSQRIQHGVVFDMITDMKVFDRSP